MPALIYTSEEPYEPRRVRLDGRDYVLEFAYNEREDRRYLTILDEDEVPIATGIKLVANWDILAPFRWDTRCPQGLMVVVDISGDASPPSLFDLGDGKRCELTYWTHDEMAALRAEP